jgi:ferritin
MDICYYNSQLKDELDGAMEYVQRAMHCKKDYPNWASMYMKMATAELDHASMLIKIFEEDYKLSTDEMDEIPQCIEDVRTTLLDMYAEFATKVKYLQEMYERL